MVCEKEGSSWRIHRCVSQSYLRAGAYCCWWEVSDEEGVQEQVAAKFEWNLCYWHSPGRKFATCSRTLAVRLFGAVAEIQQFTRATAAADIGIFDIISMECRRDEAASGCRVIEWGKSAFWVDARDRCRYCGFIGAMGGCCAHAQSNFGQATCTFGRAAFVRQSVRCYVRRHGEAIDTWVQKSSPAEGLWLRLPQAKFWGIDKSAKTYLEAILCTLAII